jgi:RHS repeat-associated protein
MSWAARHKAWGAAKVAISDAAARAGIKNPFRFQGQYFDEESGLHYNRYRYYDPHSGRFVSKDPIGLAGGNNLHSYAPNPLQWIDPLGLCSSKLNKALGGVTHDRMQAHHLIPEEVWERHRVLFKNIAMEGKRDVAANGILVPDSSAEARKKNRAFYHCGSHSVIYSPMVNNQIEDIDRKFSRGDITAEQARTDVGKLQDRLRTTLSVPLVGKNPRRIR